MYYPLSLIEKCYNYIVSVTRKQGRLLDIKTLYGDGSMFNNNFKVFESVYNNIKSYMENELLPLL